MQWSPKQAAALDAVSAWMKDRRGPQVFRLFGYAGTGKSTLAKHFAQGVGNVCYGAFTGKAALVMRQRGCAGAKTIHSLIYSPDGEDEETEAPTFSVNRNARVASADLVIIDEVSMVDADLGRDLLSFGKKVLVLGDPGQLPPIEGPGFFTAQDPDVMLTEIHRQARDNPIIQMATEVREGRRLQPGAYGSSKVINRKQVDRDEVIAADQILVGLNKSRVLYNGRVRTLKGRVGVAPEIGDKIVCLRNSSEKGLLNGQLFFVRGLRRGKGTAIHLDIVPEDNPRAEPKKVRALMEMFSGDDIPWATRKSYEDFTYGYALTVHKSQGSQWANVYLFDESAAFKKQDSTKHLYTALTRASEKITVVI